MTGGGTMFASGSILTSIIETKTDQSLLNTLILKLRHDLVEQMTKRFLLEPATIKIINSVL